MLMKLVCTFKKTAWKIAEPFQIIVITLTICHNLIILFINRVDRTPAGAVLARRGCSARMSARDTPAPRSRSPPRRTCSTAAASVSVRHCGDSGNNLYPAAPILGESEVV